MPSKNSKLAALLTLLLLAAPAAMAQEQFEGIRGRLTDTDGNALANYRVVVEPLQGASTFLSQPARADGEYVVSLPRGADFMVVAVIDSAGRRIELQGRQAFKADTGVREDIVVDLGTVTVEGATSPVRIGGQLTDTEGGPLEGFRVVFRAGDQDLVVVSGSSDPSGEYVATLEDRGMYQPLAVLAPDGRRIPLEGEEQLQARPDVRRDFQVASPLGARPLASPAFAGADRLFQFFVEDPAIVEHWRMEFQYESLDVGSYDTDIVRAVGAIQLKSLPQVELGARIGIGDTEAPSSINDGDGLTDLDVWGKLRLGPMRDGTVWAPGFRIRIPTGEQSAGLGTDALSTKLFVAARQRVPHGTLSYHAAVEVTEDGQVGDVRLDGEVAPSAGAAYIWAPTQEFAIVGEAFFGFERFDDAGADIRLSGGVNWKVPDLFTVRASLVAGLSDGAPDYQFLAGVSFDY